MPPRTPRATPARGATVWGLLAVSSDQQVETIAHQRAWALETANTHGWRLARCIEGVATGKTGPRRVVRELLAALRTLEPGDRPAFILMIRLDRIGRGDVMEAQVVLRELKELGVRVFTRDGGEEKIDSAMEQLISAAKSAVAAYENEVRVDKATSVYARKRAGGLAVGNKRPYGLRLSDNGHNGRDEADPERAAVVRQAFELRLGGAGYHAIGLKLTAIAPPQIFRNGRSTTVRWTPARVKRLLENQSYVTGGVVDEVTFLRAQRARAGVGPERRQPRYAWPLSGSIRCHCGTAMKGISGGRAERRIRYMACSASWNHPTIVRLVRADDLEQQFVDLLARLKASPESAARYRQKATGPQSVRALEKNLQEQRTELERIKRARDRVWELELTGKLHEDDLRERLEALAVRSGEITAQISDAQGQLALLQASARKSKDADALIARAVQIYQRGTDADRRAITRAVALDLGGLCVEADGELTVRRAEDPGRQRKRHADES
jgi:DNA invertase Pin-like site-specific DNA recombinase